MLKKTIITSIYLDAPHCFDGRDWTDFTVRGSLVKYELFGIFSWYRIWIYKPKIRGDYDGCYTSRYKLESLANSIRQELKYIKDNIKYKHNEESRSLGR